MKARRRHRLADSAVPTVGRSVHPTLLLELPESSELSETVLVVWLLPERLGEDWKLPYRSGFLISLLGLLVEAMSVRLAGANSLGSGDGISVGPEPSRLARRKGRRASQNWVVNSAGRALHVYLRTSASLLLMLFRQLASEVLKREEPRAGK